MVLTLFHRLCSDTAHKTAKGHQVKNLANFERTVEKNVLEMGYKEPAELLPKKANICERQNGSGQRQEPRGETLSIYVGRALYNY